DFYVNIDNVILEKKLHKYIPDVVIFSNNKKLIIEIAVTHFVGREKIEQIKESKISALEIDLSKIENDFNPKILETLIIEKTDNKAWLHNEYAQYKLSKIKSNIIKDINQKNLRDYKEKEKEKREDWYKNYYRLVTHRTINEKITHKQIEDCPLKKREYKGIYYANVTADCTSCEHSRGLRENEKYLICIYDYNQVKKLKK
ncbi:MAG: hypothetical protein U0T69_12770, partial [Chitinophagales bacterium]